MNSSSKTPEKDGTKSAKKPIDWAAARVRIERLATIDQDKRDATAEQALLSRRARELAVPERKAAAEETTIELLAFELGGQVLGVDAALVREAVFPREITALPGMPRHVRGLVNVRSRVVPAFDLRPLLQLPAPLEAQKEKFVIVSCEGTEFGLLVEQVLGLRKVVVARLRREVAGLDAKHLRGIADDGLILLELAALLPDLAVDDATEF